MLPTYLNGAISDLNALIELTKLDNTDIQSAKHELIFERLEAKNNLIAAFEDKKALIDQEMKLLCSKHPNKALQDLLDDDIRALLDSMRAHLVTLKDINAHYAQSVFAVADFYNGFIQRLIPHENDGYEAQKPQSSILQVKA